MAATILVIMRQNAERALSTAEVMTSVAEAAKEGGDSEKSRRARDAGLRLCRYESQATPWLRFFAEGQGARSAGYITSPAPNTIYNPMDLRQAYVSVGGEGTRGVNMTFGRPELLFAGSG